MSENIDRVKYASNYVPRFFFLLQTLLKEIKDALAEQKVKGRRMIIEEVSGSEEEEEEKQEEKEQGSKTNIKKPESVSSESQQQEDDKASKDLPKVAPEESKQTTTAQDVMVNGLRHSADETQVPPDPSKVNRKPTKGKKQETGIPKQSEKHSPKKKGKGTKSDIKAGERPAGNTGLQPQSVGDSAEQVEVESKPSKQNEPEAKVISAKEPQPEIRTEAVDSSNNVLRNDACMNTEKSVVKAASREVVAAAPPPPAPAPQPPALPPDVAALKDKGNQQFRCGQYATAIQTYSQAINKLKPGEVQLISCRYSC